MLHFNFKTKKILQIREHCVKGNACLTPLYNNLVNNLNLYMFNRLRNMSLTGHVLPSKTILTWYFPEISDKILN